MTFRAAALACCLLALLLAGCRPPETRSQSAGEADRQATVSLPEGPRLGRAPVRVTLEENGQAVTGASVRVTGDMTHAGMVPVISQAEETAPGDYLAEGFEFSMAGDWILTADIGYPDGSREMSELRVTVPGSQ
jgi:hypothetical protein